MIILSLLLTLTILVLITIIIYMRSFNKLNIVKVKMDLAVEKINDDLNKKHEIMTKLYEQIRKTVKKKDYLKEFGTINPKRLTSYDLDKELDIHLQTMYDLKEDYKGLDTAEYNTLLLEIKVLNEKIVANKKYFNKQNNTLIRNLKGFNKFVAKTKHITIKNSYEIKEPMN